MTEDKKRKMNNYFVYILLCGDDSYYVGITNNVERRLQEHQNPKSDDPYTAKRLPLKLECVVHFSNVNKAIECEKRIKKWSRAKKKAYIEGEYKLLPKLSRKEFLKKVSKDPIIQKKERRTPKKKEQMDKY